LDLPFEMTAKIFSHFLPPYPARVTPSASVILLGKVCRQWRHISISSPQLWRALQLNLIQERIPQQLSLLRNWLKRSGVLSLSIGVTFDAREQETVPPAVADIIQGLVIHCRRWEYMEIRLPFQYLQLIQGDMPELRSLLIGPSEVPESVPLRPLPLFTSCPQLQHIVLSRFFQPATITLCWGTLTHLEGIFLTPQECMEILGQTVNITHFKARIESSGEELTAVLALFKLECLILLPGEEETVPDDSQMQLLDGLILPALRCLRISGPWFASGNPWPSIIALVSRSSCALCSLHVTESA
ncbi:hypothetical protein B0H13DRAFT_1589596, partial [Mycena leptocephala]